MKANTHENRQSGKWNSEKPTISAKNAWEVNGLLALAVGDVVRVMWHVMRSLSRRMKFPAAGAVLA
ncbi:hypothetical protein [Kerstersia similis]|uniref:hypothetical protein n=1 Tax=Kerstersia similis TaxID=206505 RepID=UPI0039EE66FA